MLIYKHIINVKPSITSLVLGTPQSYINECIKEIYNLGDSMDNATNVQAMMTTYMILQESKVFDQLFVNIIDIATQTRDEDFVGKNCHLVLKDAWGAVYKKGHYTKPHSHFPNAYISFVYYLQPAENTPLIFSDDGHEVHPEKDQLVMFPGYIRHEVPVHEGTEDRIVIAGNLIVAADESKNINN